MKRIEAIKEIVRNTSEESGLIISNVGYASRELYSIVDSPNHFYMLGSMGLASSIGIGLSLAQTKRDVFVLDGDSSVLMNLGTLSTIGNFAPSNFHLFIMDNGVQGSTGGQKSNTAMRTNLLNTAKGAGVGNVVRVSSHDELGLLFRKRVLIPTVVVVVCEPGNADVPLIPLSSLEIKNRFIRAVG